MGQTPKGQLEWENNFKIFFFFFFRVVHNRFFFSFPFLFGHMLPVGFSAQVKRNKVVLEYLENVMELGR